jgi:hypothetical protein
MFSLFCQEIYIAYNVFSILSGNISKTTKLILLDSLLQEAEHVARLSVSDSWGSQLEQRLKWKCGVAGAYTRFKQ